MTNDMIQPSFGGAAVPPLPLAAAIARLASRPSFELKAGEAENLDPDIAPVGGGSAVVVGTAPGHTINQRLADAIAVRRAGFRPVPTLDLQEIPDWDAFRQIVRGYREAAGVSRVFLVDTDVLGTNAPGTALLDVLARLRTDSLGLEGIALAAFPEGRGGLSQADLDTHLDTQVAVTLDAGLTLRVITRLSFDAASVIRWLARFRQSGFEVPVRIGIPGPAPLRAIWTRADELGLSKASRILVSKGASLARMHECTRPDPIIRELAEAAINSRAETLSLHVHAIGGLAPTAEWIDQVARGRIVPNTSQCGFAIAP